MAGELQRFLFPGVFRLEMGHGAVRQAPRSRCSLGTPSVVGSSEVEEAKEVEDGGKGLPEKELYWLLSIMPYYNMNVKSARSGVWRKFLEKWRLGALRSGREDAIFCGV